MLAASCRKKVVKGMAGHMLKAAQDEWAHLVLMCALSVVDDTALLSKVILAELRVSAWALYGAVPMNGAKVDVWIAAGAHASTNQPVLIGGHERLAKMSAGSSHIC